MVINSLFSGIYQNRRVLITGHTGFKGSWLALWLQQMGANVMGYALKPPTNPNHFDLLNLNIESTIGDIRDESTLDRCFAQFRPEIVFHLAAQPLVRLSYDDPIETFETNVMGTLKLYEACRKHHVKVIINVTSDKCYENREWVWGYRENDPMGGYDPYSASKGCAELLTSSYRNSYFNSKNYGKTHETLMASCRAGNVIGGGDWARDRLMTDVMLSASQDRKTLLRNPRSTRPWQHVLEPLSGYLMIGQKLLEGKQECAEGWNFGPSDEGSLTVEEVVHQAASYWDKIKYEAVQNPNQPHEANLLKLDCSKAHIKLGWRDVWGADMTVAKTVEWYKEYYQQNVIRTIDNLADYIADSQKTKLSWTL